MRRLGFAMVGLLCLFLFPVVSEADTIIFDLNTQFSNPTVPGESSPWLRATFEDVAPGVVRLTLSDVTEAGKGLSGTEFVTKWDFNFDPNLNVSNLLFSYDDGLAAAAVSTGNSNFRADGTGGWFDIEFYFSSGEGVDRFSEGDHSVYLITSTDSNMLITATSFDFLSAVNKNGTDSSIYASAAHIQGIATGDRSTWVAAEQGETVPPPNPVPEPGTMLLLGSGLLGLGGAVRRRGKKG